MLMTIMPPNAMKERTAAATSVHTHAKYPSSSPSRRSRYSFSSRMSMHFLISLTFGLKRVLIWLMVSLTSWACFICLRDFMIRTMAD